jgi:hypothetical protein
LVYNYEVQKNLGIGVGLEVTRLAIKAPRNLQVSPRLDARYTFNSGKAFFFPVAQVGYGLYSKEHNYNYNGNNVQEKILGGLQYAFGLGGGIKTTGNSGVYLLLRYGRHQYKLKSINSTITGMPNRSLYYDGALVTVGYRF